MVKGTIRVKDQPGNETDLEPFTLIAGKLESTKTQLGAPDQDQIGHTSWKISKTFGSKNPTKNIFEQHGLEELSGCERLKGCGLLPYLLESTSERNANFS